MYRVITGSDGRKYATDEPLLHPPKCEWVGLTRDEYHEILGNNWQVSEVIRETEAKLKEKNT